MIVAQPQNPAPLVIKHGSEEVLRIEVDHTILHGQRVDDAGEAHRALVWALTGMTPAWRPIATAPMTGDEVLVWDRAGRIYEVARWECDRWRSGLDDEHVQPTHWMPLPPPPGK